MADPTQIEQLLQRTRDFVSRKQADEMAIFAAPLRAGMVTTIETLQESLKTLDKNDDLYAPTLKKLQTAQLGLSAFDAGEDSVRERYDASKIDTADIYQLLGDVAQEIQANLGIDWKSPDFISLWDSVSNHIVNNLFVPIDTRQFTFAVMDQAGVILDDPALGLSPEAMGNLRLAIETAMVDGENEAIKWPAAMTKDRKIGIIVAQLKESDLITGTQRNYDENLYKNIEDNWKRITYDIDQYTSASARNYADGVDEVLDKALAPTRSDEQGRLSGWLQLGTENFTDFDEYQSTYETAGMAIEDIAKWGSADALKELENYIKLQFPDALLTDAQKAARDRIIAEGKIALQSNIDSLGAKTPIEHIAAVNQNIFDHYVFGDDVGDRLGVEDQLEQAKFQEGFEKQVEDYSTFQTTFDSWSGIKGVVEEWLLRKGPIEVTDERKNQIIQRLISELPDLREFAADPQNRNTLIGKLETLYGDSALTWADEKTREDALNKFDERGEIEPAVQAFLDEFGFDTEISDAYKNIIGDDIFNQYRAAQDNPFLVLPDIYNILDGYAAQIPGLADQYERKEALKKFDERSEVEAAVNHFLDQMDFNIDISAAAKNKMGQDVFDQYQAASLNPFLDVPDTDAILGKYEENVQGWHNQKLNQELLESEDAITNAIRNAFGMDTNMQIDSPEIYTALEGKGRPRLESMVRDAITTDPFSYKSPSQYANEFMQTRGITPSGDISKYPSVRTAEGKDIIYGLPTEEMVPWRKARDEVTALTEAWEGLNEADFPTRAAFNAERNRQKFILQGKEDAADQLEKLAREAFDPGKFDFPVGWTPEETLDKDFIRRLQEGRAPQPIIDYYTRMLPREYQEASIREQLESARPPQIPQEFIDFARDYPGYDFFADIDAQLGSGAIDQKTYDDLVAQQVGDPTYARLTDADFPTREGLLGGIRDEFSGSAAGREFIERQISEENIDFSDIDARLGEINRGEGLRHPQMMPADPMALIPSFTQQKMPTLAQDFAQEQQQEQVRRGELTGAGSTIFRRRTL